MGSQEDNLAKIAALENELKSRDVKIGALEEEKSAIERQLRQKEHVLGSVSHDAEEFKEKCARLEDANKRLAAQIKTLEDDNKTLREVKTVEDTIQNRAKTRPSSGSSIVEEHLDTISRLENVVSLKNREIEGLTVERKTLQNLLREKDKQITRMDKQLQKLGESPVDLAATHANQIKKLKMDIVELQEEKRTLMEIQRLKNKAIENLTRQLDEKLSIDEHIRELREQLKAKEKESEALELTNLELQRAHRLQESELSRIEGASTDSALRALEADKRYLQSEIKKHQDARATLEKTVRAQAVRIESLTNRLEIVASALREVKHSRRSLGSVNVPAKEAAGSASDANGSSSSDGLVEDEKIDAPLYELLQKDVEELRAKLAERDALLAEKDESLEALSRNLDILSSARSADAKKSKKTNEELQKEIKKIREDLARREDEFRAKEVQQKKDNQKLRQKLAKKDDPNSSTLSEVASP
eukprot:ANDGO_07904.mRNA.1 hypothetical protein AMSG_11957